MGDEGVQLCLDAAQRLFNQKAFSAAEDFLQTALEWSSNDEKKAQIEDLLTHYKKEISKVKSNYHGINETNVISKNYKDDDLKDEEVLVTNDEEYWLLNNSLKMRKMVFQMGIQVFASKADYRTDIDFKDIECQINDSIRLSELEFQQHRFNYAEKHMQYADDIYSAAVKNFEIHQQKLKDNNSDNDTKKDSSKKHIGNTDTDSTLKSYKVTVIGDNVDLIRCLKVAETAILAKDFKKAERWIQKSERIQPNDYAKQLYRKLELAKREAFEAEIKSVPIEITEQAEEAKEKTELNKNEDSQGSKPATTNEQKAEFFLNKSKNAIAEGNSEKAQRFLAKAQRISPEVDTKDIQDQIETYQQKTDEEKQAEDPMPEKNVCVSKELDYNASGGHSLGKSKNKESHIKTDEFKISNPNYLEANSETEFEHRIDDKYSFYTGKDPMDVLAEYLNKGRTALTKNNIEKAKSFGSKARNLFPESPRVKALIKDIEETETLKRHVGTPYSSNDSTLKRQNRSHITTQTESLKKAAQDCLREAVQEYVAENYDKAEEIIQKIEKMYPLPELNSLSQKIQAERFKKQSEKQFSSSCSNTEHSFNKEKNKIECSETPPESLEQLAEQCIDDARREMHKGDLDKAEQILLKIKKTDLGVEEKANRLLQRIKDDRFRAQSEKSDNENIKTTKFSNPPENEHSGKVIANKDQLNECIYNANKALYEGDLDKADRLCQKAMRMGSNLEINKLKSEILKSKEKRQTEEEKPVEPNKNMDEEMMLDENVQLDVDKCYDLAEQAFNKRNFVKAERLLQKAIRMSNSNVPAHIDGFLCKVQAEIKKSTERAEKSVNDKASGETSGDSEKEKAVEELINKALDSMEQKLYYVAIMWLKRAENLYPTDQAKELLKDIQTKLKLHIASSRNKSTNDLRSKDLRQESEFKHSSNMYLTEAEELFQSGDYVGARYKALISDSFMPNSRAKELMQHIIHKQYQNCAEKSETPGKVKSHKSRKSQRASEPDKLFRADKTLEMAREALRFGDLQTAHDLAKESNALYPSVRAKTMLMEIKKELQHFEEGPIKRLVNYFWEPVARALSSDNKKTN